MTVTYTITRRTVEGNRRANYGKFTLGSGDCSGPPAVVRNLKTGLGTVELLEVWEQPSTGVSLLSGVNIVTPRVVYPVYRSGDTTVWPAKDLGPLIDSSAKFLASGNFTIAFTSTAGPILWKAVGRI